MSIDIKIELYPAKQKDNMASAPCSKVLKTVLNNVNDALDGKWSGEWRVWFDRKVKCKAEERFSVRIEEQKGPTTVLRVKTKPAGNDCCWEILICPPSGLMVSDVNTILRQVNIKTLKFVRSVNNKQTQKEKTFLQVTQDECTYEYLAEDKDVALKALIATAIVSNPGNGLSTYDDVSASIASELRCDEYSDYNTSKIVASVSLGLVNNSYVKTSYNKDGGLYHVTEKGREALRNANIPKEIRSRLFTEYDEELMEIEESDETEETESFVPKTKLTELSVLHGETEEEVEELKILINEESKRLEELQTSGDLERKLKEINDAKTMEEKRHRSAIQVLNDSLSQLAPLRVNADKKRNDAEEVVQELKTNLSNKKNELKKISQSIKNHLS